MNTKTYEYYIFSQYKQILLHIKHLNRANCLFIIYNIYSYIPTSAIAAHLSEKESKVLGIEKYGRAHAHGSSHGRSRIIRMAYYEDHRCK